jgi:nucleoid DNA-binding protein|tara:strand:- start:1267 stop:1626 length:360 start_codon:yes stop_codon:yes gene_type:complete
LKPKNHKHFFKDVADECGVHKDVVDDLVTFYYAKIRKSLSNLEYTNLSVSNLGTFSIRKTKLEKAIKKNKDILGNLQKMKYKDYDKYIPVKAKLESMEKLLINLNKSIKAKKKFKNENK